MQDVSLLLYTHCQHSSLDKKKKGPNMAPTGILPASCRISRWSTPRIENVAVSRALVSIEKQNHHFITYLVVAHQLFFLPIKLVSKLWRNKKPCGKANISSKTELPLANKFFKGKFLEICHYIQERFFKPFFCR